MEDKKVFSTPPKILAGMYRTHLGKICSWLSAFGAMLLIASILSFYFVIFYYVILIALTMATLGVILLQPNFRALWGGGEAITSIGEWLTSAFPIVAPITIVLAICAVVLLAFDKNADKTHLILPCIILGIAVVATISILAGA